MSIDLKTISTKIPFLKKHQREILISFCILAAIFARLIFPVRLNGELFWLNLILFFFFPWLIIRFLLKEDLKSFGIFSGNQKKGIILSLIFVAVFGILNYYIVQKTAWRDNLQISPAIVKSFWIFLWFQLVISLSSHFSLEFFFRGFLQLGLEKKLGKYAIFLQAIAQTALYARSSWIIILLIALSSLAAGTIANQSRSIFYSFISLWIISASLDIMIINYLHQVI